LKIRGQIRGQNYLIRKYCNVVRWKTSLILESIETPAKCLSLPYESLGEPDFPVDQNLDSNINPDGITSFSIFAGSTSRTRLLFFGGSS
jgi:hypothetical protein